MVWAVVSSVGFLFSTGLVIALARGRTAEWERRRRRDADIDVLVRR